MKFPKGTKVRVVDYTHTYVGYTDWVMGYCFGLFDKWKENLERTSKETRKWAGNLPIKDLEDYSVSGGGIFLSISRNENEYFRVPDDGTVGKVKTHGPHLTNGDYLYLVEIDEEVFLIGEKGLEFFVEKNEILGTLKETNEKLDRIYELLLSVVDATVLLDIKSKRRKNNGK